MLGSSGVEALRQGTGMIERAAETIATGDTVSSPERPLDPDLSSAAVDIAVGRFLFRAGVALIAQDRERSEHLLDIIA